MTFKGLGKMFVGYSADMCAGKFPIVLLVGRVEGLACADPGTRTTIGTSGNFIPLLLVLLLPPLLKSQKGFQIFAWALVSDWLMTFKQASSLMS
jgi:hypothetical protein